MFTHFTYCYFILSMVSEQSIQSHLQEKMETVLTAECLLNVTFKAKQ